MPVAPSKPNVPLNLALGLLGGLVVAVGAAFASEYFDSSVKSTEEAEELLHLPTLATIPNFALAHRSAYGHPLTNGAGARSANGTTEQLVVTHEPRSVVAEAFRTLRTAVLFSTPNSAPKLILVTSATASEGKTVNCLNLAATLAESGSRVLLVDVDLRHPSCHRAFGIENTTGLSNFLAGHTELGAIVRVLEKPNIWFIPAGPTPPNPAELVGSTRMREMMDLAREEFDFVILDSPPVTPVSDALVLARASDGVVLVVKGQDTPKDIVRRARDQLFLTGAHLLGQRGEQRRSGVGRIPLLPALLRLLSPCAAPGGAGMTRQARRRALGVAGHGARAAALPGRPAAGRPRRRVARGLGAPRDHHPRATSCGTAVQCPERACWPRSWASG